MDAVKAGVRVPTAELASAATALLDRLRQSRVVVKHTCIRAVVNERDTREVCAAPLLASGQPTLPGRHPQIAHFLLPVAGHFL
jgi:hypothetical protein